MYNALQTFFIRERETKATKALLEFTQKEYLTAFVCFSFLLTFAFFMTMK